MKTTKKTLTMKIVSIMLSIIMVVGVLPIIASATEPAQEVVYISISDDAEFVFDVNGEPVAYTAILLEDLATVNLDDYGLGAYKYDPDGGENYRLTALHLYIYVHEQIIGGDWLADTTVTGGPGSIYFQRGRFEDENLRYDYNGAFPIDEKLSAEWGYGVGATADRIVLSDGDFLNIAHFSSWVFWMDSGTGFLYFSDESSKLTHAFTALVDEEFSAQLVRGYSDLAFGSGTLFAPVEEHEVYYGTAFGDPVGSITTDGDGYVSISFPSAGTWYLWCEGAYGFENPYDIVVAPAYATVTVNQEESEMPVAQDVSAILNATLAQLKAIVTEPAFGTSAGEWTVLCLARGGYLSADDPYFTAYYERIVNAIKIVTVAAVINNVAPHMNSIFNVFYIMLYRSGGINVKLIESAAVRAFNIDDNNAELKIFIRNGVRTNVRLYSSVTGIVCIGRNLTDKLITITLKIVPFFQSV